MRISKVPINKHLKREIDRGFIKALSDLKTPDQIDAFIRDFLTPTEFDMLTKRLAVAYWLRKGRSYANIRENLKVSSATIATVHESLTKEGLKIAIKQIEAEEWANKWSDRIKKIVKTS